MNKEPKRSEVKQEDKWDLESMYATVDDWQKDYQKVSELAKKITKYKGHLLDSGEMLYDYLTYVDEIDQIFEDLVVYAMMRCDEDTTNTKYMTLRGKIDKLGTDISKDFSFATPELLKTDYSTIEKFYKDCPKLKEYEFDLKDIFRFKEHTLDEKEEKLLSTLYNNLDYPNKIANIMLDSDLKFGEIKDEDGHDIELTNNNYSVFIRSNNRDVRRSAFKTLYEGYEKFKNTLATTYSGEVEANVNLSRIRGYNGARERALFDNNIPLSVYDNLITTVNDNMDVIYKYYALKKEVLGLDELHLYDTLANLVDDYDKKYSFEEAKSLVINALSILGDDYISHIKEAFDNNWIDKYPNVGKRGGAYSSGTYHSKPFVLLNYQGLLEDVSTIAHELGHSMHSYYSKTNNPYHSYNYRIFVAEVASTVNEMLLYKYMLKNSNSKEEKLVILHNLMELFKGTIYRQTMFAEFEKGVHEIVEKGDVLTYDVLCDYYYELNKKYFGKDVVIDEDIKYEWERIPHFYMNFYVYQYATGLSAASKIVTDILDGKEGAKEAYLKFLTLGGSMYPIDELKVANVDMTKKETVESAIKMFDEIIDEFKEVYNS